MSEDRTPGTFVGIGLIVAFAIALSMWLATLEAGSAPMTCRAYAVAITATYDDPRMAMYGCDMTEQSVPGNYRYVADEGYCAKRARQGLRAGLAPEAQIARQERYGCAWSEDLYYYPV